MREIPPQLPFDFDPSTFDLIRNSVIVMMTISLSISVIAGFPLQYLWSVINATQIIAYFLLLQVNFPANFRYFLRYVMAVLTFEAIGPREFWELTN